MASSGASSEIMSAFAGIPPKAPAWDTDPGDFERALETLPLHDLDEPY